jgi:hypothetical protein
MQWESGEGRVHTPHETPDAPARLAMDAELALNLARLATWHVANHWAKVLTAQVKRGEITLAEAKDILAGKMPDEG